MKIEKMLASVGLLVPPILLPVALGVMPKITFVLATILALLLGAPTFAAAVIFALTFGGVAVAAGITFALTGDPTKTATAVL